MLKGTDAAVMRVLGMLGVPYKLVRVWQQARHPAGDPPSTLAGALPAVLSLLAAFSF